MYDCCPVTDGAVSVLLCASDKAKEHSDKLIRIAGIGHASDIMAVHDRKDPAVLEAVRVSSAQAFKMAKNRAQEFCMAIPSWFITFWREAMQLRWTGSIRLNLRQV